MMNAEYMLRPEGIATMRGLCESNIAQGFGDKRVWTSDEVFVYLTGLAETQTRIAELEESGALLVVLMDWRFSELHQIGVTGDWCARIQHKDGRRFSVEEPTKRDALLWAKRMFEQWDAVEGGKPDGE